MVILITPRSGRRPFAPCRSDMDPRFAVSAQVRRVSGLASAMSRTTLAKTGAVISDVELHGRFAIFLPSFRAGGLCLSSGLGTFDFHVTRGPAETV